MKRIAILVIAATNLPVYVHYIRSYWAGLIRHLEATRPHIQVYLLFENSADLRPYRDLRQYIIQDPLSDFSGLCDPKFQNLIIPGILSKTIHAFELLQDQYDVFFRTNLSSVIRVPCFDRLVQDKADIRYSGGFVWNDCLRETLVANGRIGPDRNIRSLSELDAFPGNTFISGSGYLISQAEVKDLLLRRHEIRYDIVDDVAIGLMMAEHELIHGFSYEVSPEQSIAEMKCRIRDSNAPHIRLKRFPPARAEALWSHLEDGQLWQVEPPAESGKRAYRIHFPLFDHGEARSNEMRMIHEGLRGHPRVRLVDNPESADHVVLCQNHLVGHCPFHEQFSALKDQYKDQTILMDYGDDPHVILDYDDFRWALYFKRSCVVKPSMQPADWGGLPIIPTAYGVVDAMVQPPQPPKEDGEERKISVSCLFEDAVSRYEFSARGRGRLLEFAKSLAARHDFPMQIGLVSPCGPIGRQAINEQYKRCLYDSKIVLHANPDRWEGDSRTWEALCSGALVFVDRMCQPIPHPLVDGEHVIFYDLDNAGMEELERKVLYYLEHDEERDRIGRQGRAFVLERHRSINRINELVWHLDCKAADRAEREAIASLESAVRPAPGEAKSRPAWQTPGFLTADHAAGS